MPIPRKPFDDCPQGQNFLGDALKHYRIAAGLSIPALAAQVGVDRVHLWRLETQAADWLHAPLNGAFPRQPSRDLMLRIAFVLRLDLEEAEDLLISAGYAPLWNPLRGTPVPVPPSKNRRRA